MLAKIGEATGCAVYAHNRSAYPGENQKFGEVQVDPWTGVGTPFDNTAYRPSGWSGSGITEF